MGFLSNKFQDIRDNFKLNDSITNLYHPDIQVLFEMLRLQTIKSNCLLDMMVCISSTSNTHA